MSSSVYRGKRVLVTGGNGFVGTNLTQRLVQLGADVRAATLRADVNIVEGVEYLEVDLRDLEQCVAAVEDTEIVFHLAAYGFGFGANLQIQPQLFTNNVLINTCMLEAAYRQGVERYLFTSSIAVYDKGLDTLDDGNGIVFRDEPHGSENYYAYAKRTGEVQCKAYHEHYGMNIAVVRLSNPYGPYDTFDPGRSHVVPAFILKAFAEGDDFLVKGSGKAVRNFVYIEDVVEGMLLTLEKYAVCDPLNLCSEENVTIGQLAQVVLEEAEQMRKRIVCDASCPEGVLQRTPLTTKAAEKIGFVAQVSLEKGIAKTIEWCKEHALEGQASTH